MSGRKKAIDCDKAYDILQCEVTSIQHCSELPPVKPKSGEVVLFCATDDNKSRHSSPIFKFWKKWTFYMLNR